MIGNKALGNVHNISYLLIHHLAKGAKNTLEQSSKSFIEICKMTTLKITANRNN